VKNRPKNARDNLRKSARETPKVPVTNLQKTRVTGTFGCHGKKKTLAYRLALIATRGFLACQNSDGFRAT